MQNAEKRIVFTNTTSRPMYVGSDMIPPGETRDFPESAVPPHLRSAPVPPETPAPASDPLADLLDMSATTVIENIRGRGQNGVPVIADEELARVEAIETAGKNRKTVLAALAEETLRRANERAEAEATAAKTKTEQDEFQALIASMDDTELAEHREIVADDAALVTLVDAEMAKRAGG